MTGDRADAGPDSASDRFHGQPWLTPAQVRDRRDPRPVLASNVIHEGYVFDLVAETADLGEAGQVRREFLRHPGAVAVVALDSDDRVCVIQQYRHPVGAFAWEIPAGLLDIAGEDAANAAARELAEEVDLRAARWDVLIDFWTSPGGSDEAIRIYLARDLSPVPIAERHSREGEEANMPTGWISLDELHSAVLGGSVHNPSTVVGVLTAHASRSAGWTSLRAADSPWPERESR